MCVFIVFMPWVEIKMQIVMKSDPRKPRTNKSRWCLNLWPVCRPSWGRCTSVDWFWGLKCQRESIGRRREVYWPCSSLVQAGTWKEGGRQSELLCDFKNRWSGIRAAYVRRACLRGELWHCGNLTAGRAPQWKGPVSLLGSNVRQAQEGERFHFWRPREVRPESFTGEQLLSLRVEHVNTGNWREVRWRISKCRQHIASFYWFYSFS